MAPVMLAPAEEKIKVEREKKKILFVCTGNTCRSPMAEAMFRFLFPNSEFEPFSRGLAADGSPISENAALALENRGVIPSLGNDYRNHVSRNVSDEDIENSDIIVGITSSHAMALMMRYPVAASRITAMPSDISDPFGGDLERYTECLGEIEKCLTDAFGTACSEND